MKARAGREGGRSRTAAIAVLALGLGLGGCGGGSAEAPGAAAPAADATDGTARTLPIPGQGGALPPGHPPVEGQQAQGGLTWDVPSDWVAESPSNSMRVAQYRVPGGAGDGEAVVFYFGPGQGGDAMSNARRWAGQFTHPDGQPALDTMLVRPLEDAKVPTQLVEVKGTYDGGMSGSGSQPGYMLLGGIAQGPDALWFFKFVGPQATVEAERDSFVALLESVHPE